MSETITEHLAEEQQPLEPSPEAPVESTPQGTTEPSEERSRLERRIGQLRAQNSRIAAERDQLAGQIAALQRRPQQQPNGEQPALDPQLQDLIRTEAKKLANQERVDERIASFHAAGREVFPDWTERCQDLMAMGADMQISQMLVEMTNGAKVAGALRDAPDELERIAGLRSERARAIALGQFSAKIEAEPARNKTRAPRPPEPIRGRAAPVFNEQEASTAQLVEHYRKQELAKQQGSR
jgi:hypothetical protein